MAFCEAAGADPLRSSAPVAAKGEASKIESPASRCGRLRRLLKGGATNYLAAETLAMQYLEATAGSPDALQWTAFTACLNGDDRLARAALVRYIDSEIKFGHAESGVSPGTTLPAADAPEMQAYLKGCSKATAKKQALMLVDFFHADYQSLKAAASSLVGKEQALAPFIEAGADLFKRRKKEALARIEQLTLTTASSYETMILFDDYYFDDDKRELGLSELSRRASAAKQPTRDWLELARFKVLEDLGQTKEALASIEKLTASRTDFRIGPAYGVLDPAPDLALARLESRLGHSDRALALLSKCVGKSPQSGQPYFVRAAIYAERKQWSAAIADLTAALKYHYSLVKALRARGACYSALGQKDLARTDMQRAAAFLGSAGQAG